MPHPHWPLFDLSIRTPRLELRYPTDDDLVGVAEAAAKGVHEPDVMPFTVPWTRVPSPEMERTMLQLHWRFRADWTPENWFLPLAVVHDGVIIGKQNLKAENFGICREAGSGSWLTRSAQGQGFGKEMRAALLFFGFEALGARVIHTEVFDWNKQSIGVTDALGYRPNGEETVAVEGNPTRHLKFRMERAVWETKARDFVPVAITGADECRAFFGAE